MPPRNLAERAGHWSARHRKIAIFGWLALVLIAGAVGSAVGTQHIADEDLGNGESREADRVLADAGFADRATEQVLVQDREGNLTFASPRFRAAVSDVATELDGIPTIVDLKSPLNAI